MGLLVLLRTINIKNWSSGRTMLAGSLLEEVGLQELIRGLGQVSVEVEVTEFPLVICRVKR